jgi:phosphopantothenoylcysteine decarboxylase/phosphopantothenate--cysteine ligase
MLSGKNVVVGVCGGIAAYKVVEVVSRLKKLNAEVDVIMTEHAGHFVNPLTFRSISRNPVVTDMFESPESWDIKHISLAEKADMILVAPATANIIGKVANGIADDMLTTTILASKAPVVFAPAMNHNMYENKIFQENMSRLKALGYAFIEPDTGAMACGTSGKGRLPEPERIVDEVMNILCHKKDMRGIKVLITAGPTREQIDPVRYISNNSTGKMGYAIASAAQRRGAEVMLVSGPVHIKKPCGVEVIDVITAEEMFSEVKKHYERFDIVIFCAAVSDYKSKHSFSGKIKKTGSGLTLELAENPDIARELGLCKGERIHIGFSAETENLTENASQKLAKKNLDMIVANDVTIEGAGFGTDTNIVRIIRKDGRMVQLPKMSKYGAALKILDEVLELKTNNVH